MFEAFSVAPEEKRGSGANIVISVEKQWLLKFIYWSFYPVIDVPVAIFYFPSDLLII